MRVVAVNAHTGQPVQWEVRPGFLATVVELAAAAAPDPTSGVLEPVLVVMVDPSAARPAPPLLGQALMQALR